MKSEIRLSLSIFALLASATVAFGCSVCGCSLSTDWVAAGYDSTLRGWGIGLRYEYSDQIDLRSGTHSLEGAELTFPDERETQQRTLNRSMWFDFNYGADASLDVAVQLPYYDRFHTTVAEGDTAISTSHATGLGDLRLLAHVQKIQLARSVGLQVGLKLPTGEFDQKFIQGPKSDEPLDRGLQLGTGTTDLLIGLSWFARPAPNLGCFSQLAFDQPFGRRRKFLPSSRLNLSGGLRWLNSSRFTPQLQMNIKMETRERGAEGDYTNSGSVLAYLSPGLAAEVTKHSNAFVFCQLPVYQRVNGLQLEARWLLSFGLRLKL